MADLYTAGMTGAQFLTALNQRKIFNVLNYGAVADDNTDNTTALQAVIELAHIVGGIVYIPSGIYKTHTLTTYTNVKIEGDNGATVLKSISAEPLVESLYETWVGKPCGDSGLHYITLDGDNIGTIGFSTQVINSFVMIGLNCKKFTLYGLWLHGSLVGSFIRCLFSLNYIGVFADGHVAMTNLVTFKDCILNSNTKYGLYWKQGLMLKLENVDMENNGVNDDATTGAILYDNSAVNSSDQSLGLICNGCWFESNYGEVVNITDGALINQLHILSECIFIGNSDCEHELKVTGTSGQNKVILRNSVLKGDNNLLIDGAYAKVINMASFIKYTITETNGGQFHNTINYSGNLSPRLITAALTDDSPTDAEIDEATGLTPATAKAGWQCTIKDSNGSGLLYKVESDGTYWFYSKMTKAT